MHKKTKLDLCILPQEAASAFYTIILEIKNRKCENLKKFLKIQVFALFSNPKNWVLKIGHFAHFSSLLELHIVLVVNPLNRLSYSKSSQNHSFLLFFNRSFNEFQKQQK